jgi:hypothetical protein
MLLAAASVFGTVTLMVLVIDPTAGDTQYG